MELSKKALISIIAGSILAGSVITKSIETIIQPKSNIVHVDLNKNTGKINITEERQGPLGIGRRLIYTENKPSFYGYDYAIIEQVKEQGREYYQPESTKIRWIR